MSLASMSLRWQVKGKYHFLAFPNLHKEATIRHVARLNESPLAGQGKIPFLGLS